MLKDLRNVVVVKVECVMGVAKSPQKCRKAGEDGGAEIGASVVGRPVLGTTDDYRGGGLPV